ncbi:SphA family protein [Paralysiella testudinis]|uniref:Transporter n=1 Tax=Paralysiella testudinis TaxID=2809020 RepID=A0A892ZM13_9NEIS|nr:transporter [Paralysiella testudinis]QRQ82726.1 transporter [Paralysiella testudinis]
MNPNTCKWLLLLGLSPVAAWAAEGGASIYPHGVENFMAGALPPPGVYGMLYGNHYRAGRLNNADGDNAHVPDFRLRANVLAPRLIWVTPQKVLGGDLALHAIVPLVDLNVRAAGQSQHKTGIGDITVGAALGYHHSEKLHSIAALDVYLPTGAYDKKDLANIGHNHSAIEPVYAISYIQPKGLNADAKFGYIINQRNKDTDYRSGDELHADYSVGWAFGNGWTAGAGGYWMQQTSADQQNGERLPNSKGSAFALGPSVKYDSGKGWFVTAKWQKEWQAKNRPQGNAVWVKAVMPLGGKH